MLRGQESEPGGVSATLGELYVEHGPEKTVGDLHEHAGAVARLGVGSFGAPVLEVAQAGQTHLDHGMAGSAVQVRHERDPAGVVLELGPVQARRAALF